MRIALIGAGGLAKEMLEVAELCGHQVVGTFSVSGKLKNTPNFGYLDELLTKRDEYDSVIIAVGVHSIDRIKARSELISFLVEHDIKQISLVSPYSRIHSSVSLGKGCYVHHDAMISCDSNIGDNVIINTSARIGHDCVIGNNTSIGPNVFVGGATKIGHNVLIGASASIKDGVTIGNDCIVGMGGIVLKNMRNGYLIMPDTMLSVKL
jgi:sugar O-acyltransferase (sialic acid O-acetyltransferase NeuD family)